jgi:hypothetical protein
MRRYILLTALTLALSVWFAGCEEETAGPLIDETGCAPFGYELSARVAYGTVGQPFTASAIPELPGEGALIYRIVSGSLPSGLDLVEEGQGLGLVVGVPTQMGQSSVSILTQDGCSEEVRSSTLNLSIAILFGGSCPPIEASSLVQAGGQVATSFSLTLPVSGGFGDLDFEVMDDSLPPGLGLDGAVISGRPTLAGSFSDTLRISDECPAGTQTRTMTVEIEIAEP